MRFANSFPLQLFVHFFDHRHAHTSAHQTRNVFSSISLYSSPFSQPQLCFQYIASFNITWPVMALFNFVIVSLTASLTLFLSLLPTVFYGLSLGCWIHSLSTPPRRRLLSPFKKPVFSSDSWEEIPTANISAPDVTFESPTSVFSFQLDEEKTNKSFWCLCQ